MATSATASQLGGTRSRTIGSFVVDTSDISRDALVLGLSAVAKQFGAGRAQQEVLHRLSLVVFNREFVVIMGPSGSGKTTLLNIISGLEKPTTGQVIVKENDLYALSEDERASFRATRFGVVYQQPQWLKVLNVVQNVALPLVSAGMRQREAEERAYTELERFKLHHLAKAYPTQLSGGEQQRVGIARATVHNPWLIIADEPTGNLDTKHADEVMEMFNHLNKVEKRTILLVTHNPNYLSYASHYVEFQDGSIVKEQWDSSKETEE